MNARELIVEADRIRNDQQITAAEWCRMAGFDECGVAVSRMYNRGNCKLSMIVELLKPLGYELKICKEGEDGGSDNQERTCDS